MTTPVRRLALPAAGVATALAACALALTPYAAQAQPESPPQSQSQPRPQPQAPGQAPGQAPAERR
ncbi:MAG TPA: hypothetical protein VLG91_12650, partial [Streptomyces sp.]|nr:hypothetical protein [Streptomyces sp.]